MDITIFILNEDKKNPPFVTHKNNQYYDIEKTLITEINQYNIEANIVKMEPEDKFPLRINSSLALILDDSMMIKNDMLNHIISLNNMFRDAGVFCGPVYQHAPSVGNIKNQKYFSSYYNYDINFGSSEICDISKDINNYPSLIGCCVTKNAFNSFPIENIHTSRFPTKENKLFISQVSKQNKIFYCNGFSKVKNLDSKDFEINKISNYYYNLGFQDGCLLAGKNKEEKRIELWRRFVSSPELLDNELPRWLFRITPEDTEAEHLEELVLLKCKYQVGLYEGMLGKSVL